VSPVVAADLLVCLAWLAVLAAAATRAYPKAIL
jgi:hypothetical protein